MSDYRASSLAAVGALRRAGPLVGRESELRQLELLLAQQPGLVSIVGPPGSGKTRLATELLARHGGTMLRCDAAGDAERVAADVQQLLTGTEGSGSREHALPPGAHLIVVDHVDDVLDSAVRLAQLADVRPGCTIVTTSNEPLRVRGEKVVRLSGLEMPRHGEPPGAARERPAVALICHHARERRPDFEITDGDLRDVAELCRLVDGLPLGLEIIGARLGRRNPSQLVQELRTDFSRLRRPSRDHPERHQSLEAAVTSSLVRCEPADLALLDLLGVAGCTVPVQAVIALDRRLGLTPPRTAEDRLERLSDRHLVRWHVADTPRVEVPSSIRHVRDRFIDERRRAELRRSLAQWFLEELGPLLATDALTADTIRLLETEHLNIRRTLRWLVDHEPMEVPATVLALERWWRATGRSGDMRHWSAIALRLAQDPDQLTQLLVHAAELFQTTHELASASRAASAALSTARASSPGHLALAMTTFAEVCLVPGPALTADDLMVGISPTTTPLPVLCRRYRLVADRARRDGDLDGAVRHLERARVAAATMSDAATEATVLGELGTVATQLGDLALAAEHLRSSLAITDRLGRPTPHQAMAIAEFAHLEFQRRRYVQSLDLVRRALRVAEEVASELDVAVIREFHGLVLWEVGDHDGARAELRTALSEFLRIDATEQLVVAMSDVVASNFGIEAAAGVSVLAAVAVADPNDAFSASAFWDQRRGRTLDAHRATLGDRAFAAAWSRGAAWTPARAAHHLRETLAARTAVPAQLPGLSARESEVAWLVADGLTDREIANRLVIGVRTVNTHVSAILRKAGLSRRVEVAGWLRSRVAANDPQRPTDDEPDP